MYSFHHHRSQSILVVVIGVGLVGSEFINQLLSLPPNPFKIISLSTSRKTLFLAHGLALSPSTWKSALEESTEKSDINITLNNLRILAKSGEKIVVVDNTSSDEVAKLYPQLLESGLNIITPNKKAFSSSFSLYESILSSSLDSGARFFNESTVGAGLPIISTLKDLVATGDKVSKIEGVFSGTMSYIFNNFSTATAGGPSFSSVVATARENGYTEPHPVDDLNGADVARKLTILSRLVPELTDALPKGYDSVLTTSLVPSALDGLKSGDEFIARLPEFDAEFDQLRNEAYAEGKVLRYVGVIDVDKKLIKASLERYDKNHAFSTSLAGSDNIIMFHTQRYGPRPLIIQGAGAGASVTAMGVMSDLFKLL